MPKSSESCFGAPSIRAVFRPLIFGLQATTLQKRDNMNIMQQQAAE